MYIIIVYFYYRQQHIFEKRDYRNGFFSKIRQKITNDKGCSECYNKETSLKEIKQVLQRLQEEVSEKQNTIEKLKTKYNIMKTKHKKKKSTKKF